MTPGCEEKEKLRNQKVKKQKNFKKIQNWTKNRQLDNWTIENRQLDKWTFEMDNWTIEVGQLDNWTIRDPSPQCCEVPGDSQKEIPIPMPVQSVNTYI